MDHENLPAERTADVPIPAEPEKREVAVGGEAPPPPEPTKAPPPEPPAVFEPGPVLELDRKELTKKLRLLFRTTERRNSLPILSCILVTSRDGQATAVATDLDLAMSVPLGAPLPEDVAFTLPPEVLPLVAKSPGETVRIQVFAKEEHRKALVPGGSDWTALEQQVQVGPVRFQTLDPREFPQVPMLSLLGKRPHASAAFTSFKQVLTAVSIDPSRLNLHGVYFRLCQYEMVATNGHRLHLVRIAKELSGTGDFLMPPKALKLMEAACPKGEEIRLDFHKSRNCGVGYAGEYAIAGAYIDGEFPNYRQTIPGKNQPNAVRVNRVELLQALAQAMAILSERARGVKLTIAEGKLALQASNPDAGRFEMDLPSLATRGGGSSLGFNARYLIDALEAAPSDVVELEWKDEVSPLRLEDGDFLGVIMPMRL